MKNYIILILLIFTLFDVKAQIDQNLLQHKVDSIREAAGIPAMAIAVISSKGKTIAVSGNNKLENGSAVRNNHLFHLGSNAKAFTATLAMLMAKTGEVELEKNIFEYIPFKENYHEGYKDLTLAKLLSHKGAIPAFTAGIEFMQLPKWEGDGERKRDNFVEQLLRMDPKPEVTYSNAGYALIAHILESVSGKPFEAMLDDFMNTNGWNYALGWPNVSDEDNPWGHMNTAVGLLAQGPASLYKLEPFIMPAGDIAMNIVDYSDFVSANLNGLNGKKSFLEAEDFQQLHFSNPSYGYGWGNASVADVGKVSYHDGSAGTYYTHVIIFPDMDYAFVGLINSGHPKHAEAINDLRKFFFRQIKNQQLTQK